MRKMILKKTFYALLAGIMLPGFIYARGAEERREELKICGLRGPSGIALIRLFEEPPKINGFDVKVEALANQDLMAARLISGEAKVGILPPNIAAKIFSSGINIRAAAVIGTGMLSLLSLDPGLRSIGDLRGKTVEVAGQGATPDYVLKKILRFYGLDPDRDLALSYSMAYPEIAQSLIAGKITTALLPEPFTTMSLAGKPGLRTVSDIQEEWTRAAGGGMNSVGSNSVGNYPMTLLVIEGTFASANPDAVKIILDAARNSIEWVKAFPAEAGQLTEKHELGLSAPVAAAAIPKSSYVFIPAAEARPSLEALFNAFLENDPLSIGGSLPGDRFYYNSP